RDTLPAMPKAATSRAPGADSARSTSARNTGNQKLKRPHQQHRRVLERSRPVEHAPTPSVLHGRDCGLIGSRTQTRRWVVYQFENPTPKALRDRARVAAFSQRLPRAASLRAAALARGSEKKATPGYGAQHLRCTETNSDTARR